MELIAELEKEKRGVYAGAVGYFGYGSVDGEREIEGAMDVSRKLFYTTKAGGGCASLPCQGADGST